MWNFKRPDNQHKDTEKKHTNGRRRENCYTEIEFGRAGPTFPWPLWASAQGPTTDRDPLVPTRSPKDNRYRLPINILILRKSNVTY